MHASGTRDRPLVVHPADVLRTLCHLADLGNCVISWKRSREWAARMCEEAVMQTHAEQRLGLPLPKEPKLTMFSEVEILIYL